MSASWNLLTAVLGGTRGGSWGGWEGFGCRAGGSDVGLEEPPAKLKPPGGAWTGFGLVDIVLCMADGKSYL